jgi:hypothetical protein
VPRAGGPELRKIMGGQIAFKRLSGVLNCGLPVAWRSMLKFVNSHAFGKVWCRRTNDIGFCFDP